MPIFEYKCKDCNTTFELLTKSNNSSEEIICPECNSANSKKLFSAFSTSAATQSFSGESCASGNCNIDNSGMGGCANGMCGLN